jgi:hypothetical protein
MVTAERREGLAVIALDFGRRARRDALPEHTQYADTGCDVHPSCLTCPLVRCRYDEPGGVRKVSNEDRDLVIVGLLREGVPIDLIARRIGVSRRTVFRALARARIPQAQSNRERKAQTGGSGGEAHARGVVGGVPPPSSSNS